MKVTIKTLSQYSFKVDIDPGKTVKEFKELIEKEQGTDYPCGSQKLIYSGKILADDKKVAEYEIDEKKFVVLMITRPVPPPKQSTPAADEKASSSTTTSIAKKADDSSSRLKDERKSTSDANQRTSSKGTSTAANTNASTNTNPAPVTGQTTTTTSTSSSTASPATTAPSSDRTRIQETATRRNPRASEADLGNTTDLRQMQNLIQHSPHLLSSAIEALASSDPELYSFISENPDMFVSVLNHPVAADAARQAVTVDTGRPIGQPSGQLTPGGGQAPAVDQLVEGATEHDKEAIERLKELGFSEYLAIQAYIACDRDEQLAANLLFQMEQ